MPNALLLPFLMLPSNVPLAMGQVPKITTVEGGMTITGCVGAFIRQKLEAKLLPIPVEEYNMILRSSLATESYYIPYNWADHPGERVWLERLIATPGAL